MGQRESGQPFADLSDDSRHLGRAGAEFGLQLARSLGEHVWSERLREGQVRSGKGALLVAMADEGRRAATGHIPRELLAECRLPDSGFTDDHEERSLARERAVERL